MKKAKNENAANKKVTAAAKEEKLTVNDPSEKIRSKDIGTPAFVFKKTLYGYDPGEVESYINELSGNNEASARNYEMKLSSIKEELALSNRERDSYAEKYRECRQKLEKAPAVVSEAPDTADIVADYEKIIDSLKEKLLRVEAENERIKSVPVQSNNEVPEEITEKIISLESENRELKTKNEAAERKNEELLAKARKYDELFAEYNALLSKHELLKAESEAKEKEISALGEELSRKSEEIGALSVTNDGMKKKVAELEAENGVLNQRAEENGKEIQRLKELNKTQAHEHADRINSLENELSADRLAMQKEIKLRDYYINQAQATLSELSEQMERIRKTTQSGE